jgi:hypothetical protein
MPLTFRAYFDRLTQECDDLQRLWVLTLAAEKAIISQTVHVNYTKSGREVLRQRCWPMKQAETTEDGRISVNVALARAPKNQGTEPGRQRLHLSSSPAPLPSPECRLSIPG